MLTITYEPGLPHAVSAEEERLLVEWLAPKLRADYINPPKKEKKKETKEKKDAEGEQKKPPKPLTEHDKMAALGNKYITKASELKEQGNKCFSRRDFVKALSAYGRASLELYPFLHPNGTVTNELEEEKAARSLQAATYSNMAKAYFALGDSAPAIEAFENSLSL